MTTEAYHRCKHCGEIYVYVGSGPFCNDPLNNSTYCRQCKGVANEALRVAFAKVERHFECRYQDVKEIPELAGITLEQVLEWETEHLEDSVKNPLRAQRIFTPLFNMTTGDSQTSREVPGRGDFVGYRFKVNTWRKNHDFSIEVPREYDLRKHKFTGLNWPLPGTTKR